MLDDWLSEPLPEDVEDLSHRGLIEFDHARASDVWVEQDGAVFLGQAEIQKPRAPPWVRQVAGINRRWLLTRPIMPM
jgi:hypothetical protein